MPTPSATLGRRAQGPGRRTGQARRRRCLAESITATAPASRCSSTCCARSATARSRSPISSPAFEALLEQFDPRNARARPRPRAAAPAGRRGDRRARRRVSGATFAPRSSSSARHRGAGLRRYASGSVRWRDVWRICERVGADALPIVALMSVPARADPRVPVGGADEALRRRDLRRRPDRAGDAARAGPADDRDPARGPLGRRVRRRDRHDESEPGGRRPDYDGPRPGALSGDATGHRRRADDAAADAVLRPRGPARGRADDAVVRDPARHVPARRSTARSTSGISWPGS